MTENPMNKSEERRRLEAELKAAQEERRQNQERMRKAMEEAERLKQEGVPGASSSTNTGPNAASPDPDQDKGKTKGSASDINEDMKNQQGKTRASKERSWWPFGGKKENKQKPQFDTAAAAEKIKAALDGQNLSPEEKERRALEILLAEKEKFNKEHAGFFSERLRAFDSWWKGLDSSASGKALKVGTSAFLTGGATVALGVASGILPASLWGIAGRLASRIGMATGLNMVLSSERTSARLKKFDNEGGKTKGFLKKYKLEKIVTMRNLVMLGGLGLSAALGGWSVAAIGGGGIIAKGLWNRLTNKKIKNLEEKRALITKKLELNDGYDVGALAANLDIFDKEYDQVSRKLARWKWGKNLVNGALSIGVGFATMSAAHAHTEALKHEHASKTESEDVRASETETHADKNPPPQAQEAAHASSHAREAGAGVPKIVQKTELEPASASEQAQPQPAGASEHAETTETPAPAHVSTSENDMTDKISRETVESAKQKVMSEAPAASGGHTQPETAADNAHPAPEHAAENLHKEMEGQAKLDPDHKENIEQSHEQETQKAEHAPSTSSPEPAAEPHREAATETSTEQEIAIDQAAIVRHGEGVEHALRRQIEEHEEIARSLKYTGDFNDKDALHEFSGRAAHRLAVDQHLADRTVAHADESAFQIKMEDGKIVGVEEMKVDTHPDMHTDAPEAHASEEAPETSPITEPAHSDQPGTEAPNEAGAETAIKAQIHEQMEARAREAEHAPHEEGTTVPHKESVLGTNDQDETFASLSPDQVEKLSHHPEFIDNPYHLSGEKLWHAYEASQKNVELLFGHRESITWHILKDTRASNLIEYQGSDEPKGVLADYMRVLRNFTEDRNGDKLEPRSSLFGLRETSEQYIARALQNVAHQGRLEEFEESLRK